MWKCIKNRVENIDVVPIIPLLEIEINPRPADWDVKIQFKIPQLRVEYLRVKKRQW